jgi:hypothetical protein
MEGNKTERKHENMKTNKSGLMSDPARFLPIVPPSRDDGAIPKRILLGVMTGLKLIDPSLK